MNYLIDSASKKQERITGFFSNCGFTTAIFSGFGLYSSQAHFFFLLLTEKENFPILVENLRRKCRELSL